jgi:hypothetical protein
LGAPRVWVPEPPTPLEGAYGAPEGQRRPEGLLHEQRLSRTTDRARPGPVSPLPGGRRGAAPGGAHGRSEGRSAVRAEPRLASAPPRGDDGGVLRSLGLPRPLWRRRGVCLALCGVAMGLVPPAVAARPAPGGHYYGFPAAGQYRADGLSDVTADLRVSRNGRSVAAVTLLLSCDSRRGRYDVKMVEMKLALGRASGGTIRRDGSFALAGGYGERRYRLSGASSRRTTRGSSIAPSMPPPRPVDRRRFERCRSGRASAVLYRNGEPPFSGCRSQRAATLLLTSTGRVLQQYALTKPRGGFFPHAYGCLFATPSVASTWARTTTTRRWKCPASRVRLSPTLPASAP